MRTGTLKTLCVAAVACATALPVAAQNRTFETPPARQVEGVQTPPGAPPAGTVIDRQPTDEALPGQTRTANYPPGQGEARGQGLNDRVLARWIATCNEAEIRINEAAQQQAESDQVKQFAAKMIKDHGMLGDKLSQVTGSGAGDRPRAGETRRRPSDAPEGRAVPENGATAPERRPGANRRERQNEAIDDNSVAFQPGTRPAQPGERIVQPGERPDAGTRQARPEGAARGMRGGNPLLMFHEEVTKQCTESTIAALKEKQGPKFDHAFMHQQVMAHMSMLDTLKVAGNHASPELKPTLDEATQHTQAHLDEAKQILEQLENQRQ